MTKTTAMYANGVGKPQDSINERDFIVSGIGTTDFGSLYTEQNAKQGLQELRDLPLSYKLAALGAAATIVAYTAAVTNPDAKAQISSDIQQVYTDIITSASAAGLSPASIAAMTRSARIYTNPAAPIPKKMVPIILGLATMVYSSGCVDKNPMEDIISDKTKEISHGKIDDSDGGMEIVDEIIMNPKTDKPEYPDDASQVIIDGWTHPMSLNPADYITREGDCTVLEKSTRYCGWDILRYLFPESKANDNIMGNNKGIMGQKPDMYMGIMYDGNRYVELIVVNQAFLDKTGGKLGYFLRTRRSRSPPLEAKTLDDFEWEHDTELTGPGLTEYITDDYGELYPDTGIYYARYPASTQITESLWGSPDKKIGMHIKKAA